MASNPRHVFKHPIPGREAAEDPSLIPAEKIRAVMKDDAVLSAAWHGMRLTVRKMISAEEFMQASDLVFKRCWDGDLFRPELLDFELRTAVVVFYSNAELPQDTEERWAVLYGTDLYETVCGMVNREQVAALKEAIETYIKK